MSYARRGTDSDIYVWGNEPKYICDTCLLKNGESYSCNGVDEIIRHVKEHIAACHKVPNYTIPRLKEYASNDKLDTDT